MIKAFAKTMHIIFREEMAQDSKLRKLFENKIKADREDDILDTSSLIELYLRAHMVPCWKHTVVRSVSTPLPFSIRVKKRPRRNNLYNKRAILICFFVFLSYHKHSWTMEYNCSDIPCFECESLKIDPEHQLKEPEALTISLEPSSNIPIGQLVMVATGDGNWRFAVIKDHSPDGKQYLVHFPHNHKESVYPSNNIRVFKLLHQLKYQPHHPKETLRDTILSFLQVHNTPKLATFIIGKIINRESTCIVIGDLHGSCKSLRLILNRLFAPSHGESLINAQGKLNPNTYLILTGDYTDRGPDGAELWALLTKLKVENDDHMILLRGNHESVLLSKLYDFFDEWQKILMYQYDSETLLDELYRGMAHALVLGVPPDPQEIYEHPHYRFLLFVHGGIDPVVTFNRMLVRLTEEHKLRGNFPTIEQQFYHPRPELSGLLWSDFFANRELSEPPQAPVSPRGPDTRQFNSSAAYEFIEQHRSDHYKHPYILDAIFRGHGHIPGGIVQLNSVSHNRQDWTKLESGRSYQVTPSSVFTCTSSPEGLGSYGCFEDSFAIIKFHNGWQVTPYIQTRVPKSYNWLTFDPSY